MMCYTEDDCDEGAELMLDVLQSIYFQPLFPESFRPPMALQVGEVVMVGVPGTAYKFRGKILEVRSFDPMVDGELLLRFAPSVPCCREDA